MADNKQVKRLSKPCYTGYSIVRRVILRESSDTTWKKDNSWLECITWLWCKHLHISRRSIGDFGKSASQGPWRKWENQKATYQAVLAMNATSEKKLDDERNKNHSKKLIKVVIKMRWIMFFSCRDNDRSAGSGGNSGIPSPLVLP